MKQKAECLVTYCKVLKTIVSLVTLEFSSIFFARITESLLLNILTKVKFDLYFCRATYFGSILSDVYDSRVTMTSAVHATNEKSCLKGQRPVSVFNCYSLVYTGIHVGQLLGCYWPNKII